MRFSITLLGRELLALELGPGVSEPEYDDPGTDGGYVTSYPVGFVAYHDLPDGSGLPYREGWDQ